MMAKRLHFPEVRRVTWETLEIPDVPEPHTVLTESICSLISTGTELAIYTGSHIGFTLDKPPFQMMPHTPGYALVGRVLAVGEAVTGIQPGQRVLVQGAHGTAGTVDARRAIVMPLPDSLSEADGALIRLAEIALTAVRVAPVQLGDSVAIYGLGLVGQLVAQLFRLNGAHPVIGIDRIESRLAIARTKGITVLNADTANIPAEVAGLTGGRGPDVVVEATGSPAVVPLSIGLAGRGGRVVLLGSPRGRSEIDPYSSIHRPGVTVIGAHETVRESDLFPRRWSRERNLRMLIDLFAAGKLDSEGLISHMISPSEALSIYDALADHPQDYLGVLIDWREE